MYPSSRDRKGKALSPNVRLWWTPRPAPYGIFGTGRCAVLQFLDERLGPGKISSGPNFSQIGKILAMMTQSLLWQTSTDPVGYLFDGTTSNKKGRAIC